ncbi:unnamed protein product [Allacma fusca]|uniref:Carrier domain-containing protein n=1 Tax=Allacma fusca TaxID=39272 RepID=A0A8J2LF02_9HEXA|nr:unnamed protein product [Allacma fusca]
MENLSNRAAHVLCPELENLITSNTENDIIIGFCLFPSRTTLILILAILKLGSAYISFDVSTSSEMLLRYVGSTRPIAIIIEDDADIASRFESVAKVTKLLTINIIYSLMGDLQNSDLPLTASQVNQLQSRLQLSERIAAIVFTSGTSGYPRCVRLSHRSIINSVRWYSFAFPFKENDVSCLSASADSANSVLEIFAPLTHGTCLVILPRDRVLNSADLVESIALHKITRVTLQPVHIALLLTCLETLPVDRISSLKYGGEGEGYKKPDSFCSLVVTYGTAEVTGGVTYHIYKNAEDLDEDTGQKKCCIGLPIWNTIVYIVDNQQKIVDLNTRGEICIAGFPVSAGFYGSDSGPKFLTNPYTSSESYDILYRTGDYGRMILGLDGKPRLFFDKRHEVEVNIHGKIYDLDKIASIILNMNIVQDCIVMCYHPDRVDQRIIAACVLSQPKVSPFQIGSKLSKALNNFVVEVFPIEKLPFQANGRIDKQSILKQYQAYRNDASRWKLLRLPSSKIQAAKEALPPIAKVLNVSVNHLIDHFHSSFYSLGGDSLNTLSTIHQLCQRGYYISVEDFIKSPTLKAIFEKALTGHDKMKSAKIKFLIWQYNSGEDFAGSSFNFETLKFQHGKEDISKMITSAYATKSVLCLCGGVSSIDFKSYLASTWDLFLTSGASVVALDNSKQIVAAILCQEFHPKLKKVRGLMQMRYIIELQKFCILRALHQIGGERNKILFVQFFGTVAELKPYENVILLMAMVKEVLERAKTLDYDLVLLVSENPAVSSICEDTVKYSPLEKTQLNNFVANDRSMPFQSAGSHESISVYCHYF